MNADDSSESPQSSLLPTGYERSTGGHVRWQPPSVEHLQALLPQYEIISLLGHGGMGAVYQARQITLDRLVAIKILPPEAADDGDANFVERFKNEARTMGKMNHPGIVHVHDFGETAEGQLYFVMEFVEGTDVQKMIKEQRVLPPDHALAITAHVCDALQYAHTHGVIHRDIKPANVLIDMEGAVKVADFGLAKISEGGQTMGLTMTGTTMGTPDYVAPEALTLGMVADHRADLYAVGVMLYHMLTGEVPRGKFKMPSQKVGSDVRYDAIIDRAMENDREERYQSALEIRQDLDNILSTPVVQEGGQSSAAIAQQEVANGGPLDQSPSAAKSKPWLIPAVLAGVAMLGIGGWIASKPKATEPFAITRKDETSVAASGPSKTTETPSAPAPKPEKPKPAPPTPDPPKPVVAVVAAPAPAPKATPPVTEPKPVPASAPVAATTITPMPPKEAVTSPPAEPSLPAELVVLDEQFLKLQAERVTAPFDADVSKLNTGYMGGIDRDMAKAKAAGQFDAVLGFEAEKKLVTDKKPVPSLEDEEASEIKTPDVVKKLRVIYREAYAKLEVQRAANLKPITDPLNVRLLALESDYIKKDRSADAKLVREYQESLGEVLAEMASTEPAARTGGDSKTKPIAPTIGGLKDGFTNTLGMKFMHITGAKVLFCIHTVRRKDYAAYVKEVPTANGAWRNQVRESTNISEGEDDPVVGVNWNDANDFCEWLSKKEGHAYRLPTDREWSYAAGVALTEKSSKSATPESLSDKVPNVYPWGTQFPPPKGSVNLADTTYKAKFPVAQFITDYNDGFPATAPVMSFKPNKYGLYDMGGNVQQWCEDWYNETKAEHVMRGSDYTAHALTHMLSSHRFHSPSDKRSDTIGFRLVVVASPAP